MQATLNKLETIGAVAKTTSGGRGRTATLFVTEEGKRLLAVGYSSYTELDALLAERIDPKVLIDMALPFVELLRSLDPG